MATDETKVRLGKSGPEVHRIGLGCMGMSGAYGAADEAEGIATIQHAIDRGITLLDTGDFYSMGHNERLIRKAIAVRRDQVTLSVKFGALRDPRGQWLGTDTRPAAVKNFVAYSLDRLGVEAIDVYRPARLDPNVPIEDTVGAIAELIEAGYVKHVGLSEVGVDTIRRAAAVHPISDLQIEYALVTRGPEKAIFPVLRELGASATIYGIFSRGLLTGSKPAARGDYRAFLPRFKADGNQQTVEAFAKLAKEQGRTPAQLALGWVLARQPGFVALIGAKKPSHVDEALEVVERPLSEDELAAVERVVPESAIEGTRYGAEQMKRLDSER